MKISEYPALQHLQAVLKAYEHRAACDYPEEVRFRCANCAQAARAIHAAQLFINSLPKPQ